MRDKGLEGFLMALFGIGGIVILVFTWTQATLAPGITSTFVGSAGILFALTRVPLLVPKHTRKASNYHQT